MKSAKLISLAITMLIPFVIFGQEKTITGTISDGEDFLPGATVLIKNTNKGTQSDFYGAFSINAQPKDTLAISFIGMKTKLIPVGDQKIIAIKMENSEVQLREVYDDPIPRIRKKEVISCGTQISKADIEVPKKKPVEEEKKNEIQHHQN